MKTTFYLAALVLLFASCTKETINNNYGGSPQVPAIDAHIVSDVFEPYYAVLGDENTAFNAGDRVTVYAQVATTHEYVNNAILSVFDESGQLVYANDMTLSEAPYQGVSYPQPQENSGFYSTSISIDENLKGKKLTLRVDVNGQHVQASHEIINAFSVHID